jgi:ketosteroid isomerase-like protein
MSAELVRRAYEAANTGDLDAFLALCDPEIERHWPKSDRAVRGRGRSSGLEIDDPVAHLWEFRGGRAVRLRMFGDVERARQRFLEG